MAITTRRAHQRIDSKSGKVTQVSAAQVRYNPAAGATTNREADAGLLISSPSAERAMTLGDAGSGVDIAEADAYLASRAAHRTQLFDTAVNGSADDRLEAARELAWAPVEWMGYAMMPADERATYEAAMNDDAALKTAMDQMPKISNEKQHIYGPALAERVWRNTIPDADDKFIARILAKSSDAEDVARVEHGVYVRQMQAAVVDPTARAAERAAAARDLMGWAAWPGLDKLNVEQRVALWSATLDDRKLLGAIEGLPASSKTVGARPRLGERLTEQMCKDHVQPGPAPLSPEERSAEIQAEIARAQEAFRNSRR